MVVKDNGNVNTQGCKLNDWCLQWFLSRERGTKTIHVVPTKQGLKRNIFEGRGEQSHFFPFFPNMILDIFILIDPKKKIKLKHKNFLVSKMYRKNPSVISTVFHFSFSSFLPFFLPFPPHLFIFFLLNFFHSYFALLVSKNVLVKSLCWALCPPALACYAAARKSWEFIGEKLPVENCTSFWQLTQLKIMEKLKI